MSSTDDRIVRMHFDNKSFMKGAADTQKALSDTNKAVDGAGKSKGLLDLSGQMETVGITASKMAIVTTTALATIANKAVNAGLSLANSLTLNPLKEGFTEYESLLTKQNVIMNATGKSATEVKGYLTQLNKYSDQTIYSFADMTDNITKFVNAGVSLPKSVTSIKGVANAAAYAGASSVEAGRAMYAFSQSMQTGFIMLNDWMQIENANMGTQQFKQSLIDAGVAAGTLTKKGNAYVTATGKYVSTTKGWRDSLQEQWATVDVLNMALGQYADKSTELGRKAFKSAQDVRTFTAFMDTLKESIASGWAAVFTSVIGGLKEATVFWTSLANSVAVVVTGFFDFIAVALETWRTMGGFEKTIQGFKNLMAPFAALLKAIGAAWNAAFPNTSSNAGQALYGLSAAFELITRPLAWLAKGLPIITPLLTVLFKAIALGGSAIGNVVGMIVDFVKAVMGLVEMEAPNAGGILGFFQTVGIAIQATLDLINKLIDKGKSLGSSLGGALGKLSLPSLSFGGGSAGDAGATVGDAALSAAKSTASGMAGTMETITSLAVKMGDAFRAVWDGIKTFVTNLSPEDVVKSFNQAVFATMAYEVIRLLHSLRKGFSSIMGFGDAWTNVIEGIKETMTGFAQAAKREAMAKMIISVAIALGILAVSLWILSKIPIKHLVPAMAALTFLMFRMASTVNKITEAMTKMKGKQTPINAVALSIALVALGLSLILLATSAKIMDSVSLDGVLKSAGIMFLLMKMMEQMGSLAEDAAGKILAASVAFIAVGIAMNLLAGALLLFQLVKWESMAKAGLTLAALATAIGLLTLIPYQGIGKVGLALLAASVGMIAMANALILFALVKWESIGKAAVMLTVLALALGFILAASGGGAGAAVILALSAGLVALALAGLMLNEVDWESIGKISVVLVALIVALGLAAAIMTAFLYAIAPVAPVLTVLAAGFALFGLGLLAFSAALALAISLAAAGTAAFAALATGAAVAIGVFFQTLSQQAGVIRDSLLAIIQAGMDTLVQAAPIVIQGFKDLWKAIMKELQSGDKKKSFGDIMEGWLDKLHESAKRFIPKLTKIGVDVVLGFLKGLISRTEEFSTLGIQFLTKLISGIGTRMHELVETGTEVVIKFITGLERNAFKLINAGINLIATFLHDLASAIRNGSAAIGAGLEDVADAMKDVGIDMVRGLIGGVTDMAGDALGAIGNLASGMVDRATSILEIFSPSRVFKRIGKFLVQGLTKGIQDNAASAIVAVASMVTGAIAVSEEYMNKYFQRLDQRAIKARARAQGLAAAAAKAQKSADKTKTKEDDKSAKELSKRAKAAAKDAREEEKAAKKARQVARQRERWREADSAERAEIRGNQAQAALAGAKQAEKQAEAARIQANALEQQAKSAGNKEERDKLLKAAEEQRKIARAQAKRANTLIKRARKNSTDALKFQKLAAEEAAEAFQKQFDAEAKADADAKEFEKLSDEEKAEKRRQQADRMQARADANLERAKKVAARDLDRANELAQRALAQAEEARRLRDEADRYGVGSGLGGQVLQLDQSDAAALAYSSYADLYESSMAAAAAGQTLQFNQYNTSPEALSEAEIYRNTNNQLTFANEKLAGAA